MEESAPWARFLTGRDHRSVNDLVPVPNLGGESNTKEAREPPLPPREGRGIHGHKRREAILYEDDAFRRRA